MSTRSQTIALGSLTAVALGVLAWVVWGQFAGGSAEVEAESNIPVLCANPKCRYVGECSRGKLVPPAGGKDVGRAPVWGPGYKCPRCGQDTLYAEPMKCRGCGTLFLSSRDASGSIVDKCPKCGQSY